MAPSVAGRSVESEILSEVEIFSCLTEEEVDELADIARLRTFKKGESIYHQEDPSGSIFVVASGAVKLHLTSRTGKLMTINCKMEGDWFGVLSFFDQEDRPVNAATLANSKLLVLSRDPLRKFLEQHPKVSQKLTESMAKSWRRHIERIYELAFMDAPGRLVAAILQLSRYDKDAGGPVIKQCITQGELASFARTSRESVNKWLSVFESKGWVQQSPAGLKIVDPDALRRYIRSQ